MPRCAACRSAIPYRKGRKRLHLRDCLELLTKATEMVEIDVRSDPHYHIADNKLG